MPWSFDERTRSTSAMAPVAAEIMPGRPPANEMMMAIENEAYRPTLGSTPAMIENEIASGMSARATTRPDRRLALGLVSQAARTDSALGRRDNTAVNDTGEPSDGEGKRHCRGYHAACGAP